MKENSSKDRYDFERVQFERPNFEKQMRLKWNVSLHHLSLHLLLMPFISDWTGKKKGKEGGREGGRKESKCGALWPTHNLIFWT